MSRATSSAFQGVGHQVDDGGDCDVSYLAADRSAFDAFVYMPLKEAFAELRRRRSDEALQSAVIGLLGGNIPEPLVDKPKAVLFRHLATPNFEIMRFLSLASGSGWLDPVIFEHTADRYTTHNECKRTLGKLYFHDGIGRNSGSRISALKVIDLDAAGIRQISSLRAYWGESLVGFHHEMFWSRTGQDASVIFDASNWFHAQGATASEYYLAFLLLFVRHGILFENFLLDRRELSFTENVVLPTLAAIRNRFGLKPLIVALEPTEVEEDRYWKCYPNDLRTYVEGKLAKGRHSVG